MANGSVPPGWPKVDAVFTGALEVPEPERSAYVDRACGNDRALREEVMALLDAAERSDAVFESSRHETIELLLDSILRRLRTEAGSPQEDLSGRSLGAWRLEKRLARGGYATVYLARRDDGLVNQRAAVKVLRRGLDTGDILRRFEAERQILSSLDSSSVARLLDAGSLPDGRPYLVMDHVEGAPIDEYCRRQGLDAAERVALFVKVARAVDQAHRRLVIHRDLKPSNVFVTPRGDIRLLDFGIAKLLDPSAMGLGTMVTRALHQPLTPEYASPEQFSGEAVTVASDVYQLGVLLFVLLTGRGPFSATAEAGSRRVERDDPPAPSRIAVVQAPDVATGVPADQIGRDLDAIVLKALQQNPDARYRSAAEMADDLERYLERRPVTARAATAWYRFGKLVRRKPWLVPTTVLALVAVAGYVATLQIYSLQVERERDAARRSKEFLIDVLQTADPYGPEEGPRGRDVTVAQVLDIAVERVATELNSQPKLQASLYDAIAGIYANLDELEAAIAVLERRLAIERERQGERSPGVVPIMLDIANLVAQAGDRERAGVLREAAWEIATAAGPGHEPLVAATDVALGLQLMGDGYPREAVDRLEQGVTGLRAAGPSEALIESLRHLSTALQGIEDAEGSLAAAREAVEMARLVFPEDSVTRAIAEADVAKSHTQRGEYAEAKRGFEAALPILEQKLGPTHRVTLAVLNNYAYMYNHQGQHAAAEPLFRRVLQRRLERGGEEPRGLLAGTYQNLGAALMHIGKTEEALPYFERAHEIYRAVMAPNQFQIALPLLSLAVGQLDLQQPMHAEATARQAIRHFEQTLPEGHFVRAVANCVLGRSLEAQEQTTIARDLLAEAWPTIDGNPNVPRAYVELCAPADPG